jgi:hypothetical protein
VLLILEKVGAIVYNVKNNARPMIAIVGGIVCVVKARLTKERTITILVNDVIITRRLGRIARPLKIITSLTGVDQSLPSASSAIALSITSFKSVIPGSVLDDGVFEGFPGLVERVGCSIPKEDGLI